jgi:lysophospholipase L1-like esterase
MLGFYSAMTRTLSRCDEPACQNVTRILHYGDSHVASGLLTGPLRASFQRDLGDAGPGFVFGGRPWSWYKPYAASITASSGWHIGGLGQTQQATDSRYGVSGVSFSANAPDETITLTANCKLFDIYLLKQPAGGLLDVYLDDTRWRRVSVASDRVETSYLQVTAQSEGPHTIQIRTLTAGQVRVLGIVAETGTSGVEYDVLGINGARAYRPLEWDFQILASNLARRRPSLIIVSYGSNEVNDPDLDIAEYQTRFSGLLHRFRLAAPQASLLVIAPPDRAVLAHGIWRSQPNMPALVEAQRRAAFSERAAFWNLFRAMGGAGSAERWANKPVALVQHDRVHLTRTGYQLVADSLYREIARGYLTTVWRGIGLYWLRQIRLIG